MFRLVKDVQSFQSLNHKWNKLLFSLESVCPFLTHEWFSSWWECFGKDFWLNILLFENDRRQLCGIAPLMCSKQGIYFMASQEVTDYCDFICSPEKREEFFDLLLNYLTTNHPDKRVELINIPHSSPSLFFLSSLAPQYNLHLIKKISETTPVLPLPSSYKKYLTGLTRKNRHEIRRKLKRINCLSPSRTISLTQPQKIMPIIERFRQVHKNSSPQKREFWEKEGMSCFFKEMSVRFATKGWLEMDCLFSGPELISVLLNFTFPSHVYFYNVAYNTEYAWYSPGLYLFQKSIKRAITQGKKEVDFLRGNEQYKYNLGAEERKIYNLTLIPKTPTSPKRKTPEEKKNKQG